MASKVSLCNLALTRIGAERIITLDENTQESKDCFAIFDLIAEEVMSIGSWPSVRRRSTLVQLAETPAFEFTYAYQLPTNPKFLKLIYINESVPGEIRYSIEGNKLLTDESSIKIKYLAYITDVESYDIFLRQAIVDRLAAELSYKRTGNISLYQASLKYAHDHAQDLLSQAGTADSAEFVNSDTYIQARDGIFPDDGRDT